MVWEWYDTVKNFILSILMWPPTDLDEKQYRHTCLGGHPMTVCSILSFLLSSFIVSPLKHILLFWIIYKIPMFPNSLIYISFKLNNYLWTTDHSSRHPLLQMCNINDSIIRIVPSMFVWIEPTLHSLFPIPVAAAGGARRPSAQPIPPQIWYQ